MELTNFQIMSENVEKAKNENAQKEEDFEDAPEEFKGKRFHETESLIVSTYRKETLFT